ncbi:MAG: thrombospondin type 3 repeat-containing protein [Polyangiaceae bacterium]|nr:thrombospondin type 3 repeat-containing protein [Polyangiaceae bacterium]
MSLPAVGYAQPSIDGDFSVQRFMPAPGPHNFVTTRGARVSGEMAFSAGLVASYAYQPFSVVSCESATNCDESSPLRHDIDVVKSLATADVLGSFTPIPMLQIGLRVPVTWVSGDGINEAGLAAEGGLKAGGLGDIELEAKARFFGEPDDTLVLGAAAFATAPTGRVTAENSYIGDESLSAGLRAIVDVSASSVLAAVNLGGAWRKAGSVGSADMGPEARVGVGVGYQVTPLLLPMAELYATSRLNTKDDGTNVAEALLGVKLTPVTMPFVFMAGGGTGLLKGVGAPTARGFLGVSYVSEARDRDEDGVLDDVDQCPAIAEDRDGYEDDDGCPDNDNDGDLLPDKQDKCPDEAEDPDGFQDTDGCPDLDNDKDGIPDDHDACPNKPETKNGFKDKDGCPDEVDTDGDGIPDARDKCPNEAEDMDGFQDDDGCADLDNDQDGVPDDRDECYLEPETQNGFEDEDGCPDEAPDAKAK